MTHDDEDGFKFEDAILAKTTEPQHRCEDCGSPVELKVSGKPAMEVAYSIDSRGGETYHDMSQCIFYLRTQVEKLQKAIESR